MSESTEKLTQPGTQSKTLTKSFGDPSAERPIIRVCHVSFSDIKGGAARAAYRIHASLHKDSPRRICSEMRISQKLSDYYSIHGPKGKRAVVSLARLAAGLLCSRLQRTHNRIFHSPSVLPCRLDQELNQDRSDLLHLHWINGEML